MRYNHLDMLPELAFKPVGKRMTLEGMGGGGSQQQQSTTGIDPILKPYVEFGLGEAKNLYQGASPQYYPGQTYVAPSAQTTQALTAAGNRAMMGNPLLPAAQQQQQAVIGGQYLNSNPYFNQALAGASQGATQSYMDAIKAAQGGASMAGRYGSGVSADIQNRAANTLANTLANKYGDLAYQNYATERGRQEAAVANAPALANADYTDINQLLKTGQAQENYANTALQADINRFNYEQNLPTAKLNQYAQYLSGTPQGSVTTSTSSGGKIVCTAMNEAYGFGSFRQAIWLQHSATMPNAKTIEKGYHTLFLPVVAYAFNGTPNALRNAVRRVAEHIARHRTADLWKEMRGKKRDPLGRIYRAIIEPICYLVGKVKGA
jgi:hypothetical protein